MEAKLGADHPDVLVIRNNLAEAYLTARQYDEAAALHELTLRLREAKLGPDHPDTLVSLYNVANAHQAAGRTAKAVPLFEAAHKLFKSRFGDNHSNTLVSRISLTDAYESLGRWADAESLRREGLALRPKATSPDLLSLADDLGGLGCNLLKQAKWSEAEPVLRECLAIREKVLPDDWRRFNAISLLGGALLGQGKYAQAETLVVVGYEGVKAREAKIAADSRLALSEAAERLVWLYEAWGKPGQAQAWASRLGLADLPDEVFTRP